MKALISYSTDKCISWQDILKKDLLVEIIDS